MCGVNGIFAYHVAANAPRETELLATRDAMRARGPDGSGVWWSADRRCALGHRRLSILDLSDRAAQPMLSADGNIVVTFNGEIYNYRSLRAELEAGGARFRTTSDTEALLHLYARDGDAMVHRLRGMFAFAIWDERRRELFLARDPYGIKPLYTANDGWTFRFASQVKALIAGGGVSREPEPAGIAGFHLFGSVPEPFTLYRDIRALPAGHTQRVDAAGPREPVPFASLAAILAAADPVPASDLGERVRAAVRDSVRAHLLADVEVGMFLSAGVDSGALLGLMADAGGRETRAITLAFDEFRGTAEDEAPLAARIAERYGAQHIVRRVDEREFRADLPAIIEAMDQPSIDGVNTWFVAKAAKEAGLKVALSGLGGDELLAGYPSFTDVPRWRRRFGPVAAVPGLGRAVRPLIRALAPGLARRAPKALGLLEYGHSWAGAYLLRRGLFLPFELKEVIDPEVTSEGLRRLAPLRRVAASLEPDPGSDVGRVCALELAHYLRNQLLRDADWAGMAHGVEIRVPLVDVTVLETLAPALPALAPSMGKAALANAPSVPLPDEILARAKTGFSVPTGAWINRAAEEVATVSYGSSANKGLASRDWSKTVFGKFAAADAVLSRGRRSGVVGAEPVNTVLVFRIGSLGDTIVALPCFHQVERAFPNFRRVLITDVSASPKLASVDKILAGSGLIDDVIQFPPPPRRVGELLALRSRIRATGARVLVYIADRHLLATLRDVVFFRLCGVRRVIGAPIARDLRRPRIDPETGHQEREAGRLARCLSSLGPIDLDDPGAWDLHLLPEEQHAADAALAPLSHRDFIAVSIGTKWQVNDWGDTNWAALLHSLSAEWANQALVFFGAGDEFDRSAALAAGWRGPILNLCGRLLPRESAAALGRALVFIGHDSGPMHLASAVGVPCVAIFGNRYPPKRWHPVGRHHRIIHEMRGVPAIPAVKVHDVVRESLAETLPRPDRLDYPRRLSA